MRSTSRKRLAMCRLAHGLPPAPGRSPVPPLLGFWGRAPLFSPCLGETLFAPVHDAEPEPAQACALGIESCEDAPL